MSNQRTTPAPIVRIRQFVHAHPFITGLMCFALLAWLSCWPVGPFNTSHLPDAGTMDQGGAVWALEWVPYALLHNLNIFHTNYIDYPLGADLAFTPPAPLLSILVAPITLTLGPVAAFNSLTFLSFFASAGSMYAVLHLLRARWIPAFIGSLFFGFNPYMVSQAQPGGHILFEFMALLPWIIWCLYDLFITQERRPFRMGLLLGALLAGEAYIALEVVGDLAITVGIGFVIALIIHPRPVIAKLRHVARAIIPTFVVFIVPVSWQLWWAIKAPDRIIGPTQPVNALQADRVNLFSPLVPLSNQLVAPSHFAKLGATYVAHNLTENGAYLGVPLVVMLIVGAITLRKNILIRLSCGIALIAFIFSLGSRLDVGDKFTSIPLPEALLPRISLLDNTVPARFSIIVVLFVGFALGIGIDAMWEKLRASRRSSQQIFAIAAVIGVLVLVPLLPRAPFTSKPLAWSTVVTSSIDDITPGTVVLTYPYTVPQWPEPMVWQAITHMRIRLVGGYANVREPNGTSSVESPLLLSPYYVEDFFTQSQFGSPWFQKVGPPNAADQGNLCTFLRNYNIGAIVVWDAGATPRDVASYVVSVVGTPTLNQGTVLTWINPVSRCP